MASQQQSWTLGELAALLEGELVGDPSIVIVRPAPSDVAEAGSIAYVESEKYLIGAEASDASALIVDHTLSPSKPHIRVSHAKKAFNVFLSMCYRELVINEGIHSTAQIDPSAKIHPTARIGAFVVIESDVVIGENVRIYASCYIGPNCSVGKDSALRPKVTLIEDCHIGERTVLHAGVVIGSDGFGYGSDPSGSTKIHQVGGVKIGNDVEIGSLTTVDRAKAGYTEIGDGTKIDNLVQIGHNVRIGRRCIIVSQSGIAGSAKLGDGVIMAGQTGVKDNVSLAPGVILLGRGGATKDLKERGLYAGFPATDSRHEIKTQALSRKLPDLIDRVKALEAEIQALKEKLG